MATPVTMPQLGETVVEGTITRWLKQEGEHVDRDEPLFEISTDKVDTEVPSPLAGTIVKIKVPEGETVSVGTELAVIDEGASAEGQAATTQEAPSAEPETSAEPTAGSTPAQPEPTGSAPAQAETARQAPPSQTPAPEPARAAADASASPQPVAVEAPPQTAGDGNGRVSEATGSSRAQVLSPLVRRLAEEHKVDLGQIRGTGTGGRITKRDVLSFVEGGGAQPAAAPGTPPPPAVAQPAAASPAAPAPAALGGGVRRPSRSRGCARRSPGTWCRRSRPRRVPGTWSRWTWRTWCAPAAPPRTSSSSARA